ncbi:solute-binding protein [Antarctobacter heliothermus]|uniref:Solute-binding protein n=1 Tax=Antarctobacter heliothermus TaxID=74033 RepID=A0A222E2H5_9RHOB|nr:TRAP transporter substrate-binding protein [Antarctobacter heliothermus]ASP20429.1 solute-binding protein [Antarctobacter heliothermus]
MGKLFGLRSLVGAAAVAASMGGAAYAQDLKLGLAHNVGPDHVMAETLNYFADRVAEFSDGSIEVVVYGGGQMGETRDVVPMMQQGAMDMNKSFHGELEAFEPSFFVFNVPYLFQDIEHLRRFLYSDAGTELSESVNDKGFFNLAAYGAEARSFYTNKPIRKPEDLDGAKIRVFATPTTNRMVELMGGAPAPIPWGETYSAIQQGVIDGSENNITSYVAARHYEVAKIYSKDEHTMVVDYLSIATKTWDKLTDEQKSVLKRAARASEEHQQEVYTIQVADAYKLLEEKGIEIVEVDKEAFRKSVQPLIDELMQDPEKAKWIERARALAAE